MVAEGPLQKPRFIYWAQPVPRTPLNSQPLTRPAPAPPPPAAKRDGKWLNMDATMLVPGDLVLLAAGAAVPADCIVNEGRIEVDQAALTGARGRGRGAGRGRGQRRC